MSTALLEQVQADIAAIPCDVRFIKCELSQEFNKPVVVAKATVPQLRIPNLVLRAFNGYPAVGTVTYSFEIPPMGWCGSLREIRDSFKVAVASFEGKCGVDDVVREWAAAMNSVIYKENKH